MKKLVFSCAFIICALCMLGMSASTTLKATFKVWGNCGMCEKRIESAAMGVKGVSQAEWDADKGLVTLVYNPAETNVELVQTAIAAVGYDTEKVKANDKAYAKLPGCCQYDRKK